MGVYISISIKREESFRNCKHLKWVYTHLNKNHTKIIFEIDVPLFRNTEGTHI